MVVLRIIWGFIGPRWARCSDFVYGPGAVFGYLRDLVLGRAARYLGHSPAGGAMTIALLLFLPATVATGSCSSPGRRARQLTPFYTTDSTAVSSVVEGGDGDENENEYEVSERRGGESVLGEIHETFANVTLALVILHLRGVALASLVHHENLARAMITGRKRSGGI